MTRPSDRLGQHGFTVAELAVSIALLAIVMGIVYPALFSSDRTLGHVNDEAQGLSQVKTIVERLSRDLRGARGVDATATAAALKIWVDKNSDYAQTPNETITWRVTTGTPPYAMERVVADTGTGYRVGESLVTNAVFTYLPTSKPLTERSIVRVQLTYDAVPRQFSKQRTANFEVRLRNVG